jgi:diguanylate cyclase (GGDEF)-like protein
MNGSSFAYLDEKELGGIDLFRQVPLESIKGLIDACTVLELQPEETLIKAGQPNHTMYFVLDGRLRVHLDDPGKKPVALLGPGESIGEMSVIDQQPASAFVIADTPCRLLVMEEEILWSLVQSSHEAACNLLFILTRRLRNTDSVLVDGRQVAWEFRRLGTVDALTGLHNREWLDQVMTRQCARCDVAKQPLSVVTIDIDHFKEFNDRFGQVYGDHILYWVAHTLTELLRPNELIARYDGDKFVVVLPEQGLATAKRIADRLQQGVQNAIPATPDGRTVPHPTSSIGIAEMKMGQAPDSLLEEAGAAMRRAKEQGRNRTAE